MSVALSQTEANALDGWLLKHRSRIFSCPYSHSLDTVLGQAEWSDDSYALVLVTCRECGFVEWVRWPKSLSKS
jgi:hypothetical protein